MLGDLYFPLLGQKIAPYGICIGLGILACLTVFFILTKKRGMKQNIQDFTFFIAIVAIASGFLFAKLFQAFYVYLEKGYFNFYSAGVTVMGGIVGGASTFILLYFLVGHFYFKGKNQALYVKQFSITLSVAPICIAVAHAFGRIGCLMSGCCHGDFLSYSKGSGGIYMLGDSGWGYYVPIQLYESIFLFILFAVLVFLFIKRCNITMSIYLIAYAIWRFIIEIFRGDYRAEFTSLSPSQIQSIIFFAVGVAILIYFYVKKIPFFLPNEEIKEEKK